MRGFKLYTDSAGRERGRGQARYTREEADRNDHVPGSGTSVTGNGLWKG